MAAKAYKINERYPTLYGGEWESVNNKDFEEYFSFNADEFIGGNLEQKTKDLRFKKATGFLINRLGAITYPKVIEPLGISYESIWNVYNNEEEKIKAKEQIIEAASKAIEHQLNQTEVLLNDSREVGQVHSDYYIKEFIEKLPDDMASQALNLHKARFKEVYAKLNKAIDSAHVSIGGKSYKNFAFHDSYERNEFLRNALSIEEYFNILNLNYIK